MAKWEMEALQIYPNKDGGVTIEQSCGWDDPDRIFLTLEQVPTLIDWLKDVVVHIAENGSPKNGQISQD